MPLVDDAATPWTRRFGGRTLVATSLTLVFVSPASLALWPATVTTAHGV